jgi:hypothetical protein
MNETNIMQELDLIISYMEVTNQDNIFIINKLNKVREDLEFYFGSSEYYSQQIKEIINHDN